MIPVRTTITMQGDARHGQAASSLSPPNSFSVRCPRRFQETKPCNFARVFYWYALVESLTNAFSVFFLRQILVFLYFLGYLGLKESHISGERKRTVTVRQGHIKHVCKITGSPLTKTAWTFGPLCDKHAKLRPRIVITWFQCTFDLERTI